MPVFLNPLKLLFFILPDKIYHSIQQLCTESICADVHSCLEKKEKKIGYKYKQTFIIFAFSQLAIFKYSKAKKYLKNKSSLQCCYTRRKCAWLCSKIDSQSFIHVTQHFWGQFDQQSRCQMCFFFVFHIAITLRSLILQTTS